MNSATLRLCTLLTLGILLPGNAIAWAQATASKDEILPPKAIYKPDPSHPEQLYLRGIEGAATIMASVDRFGTVIDPIVERGNHEEFGLSAMLAASEWIFEPAMHNGVPIDVKVRIPFEFTIAFEHKINVELGRDVFKEITNPVIPSFELDQAPLPSFVPVFVDFYPNEFRNTGKSAAVSVEFIIDPKGDVVNPKVTSTTTEGFEEAAVRAVSQMRYKPIRVEGEPAYVSLMMPIQFSE